MRRTSRFGRCRVIKNNKNHKKSKTITTTTPSTGLLYCSPTNLLSSFFTQILKSKLLPFFSCCWLLCTGTTTFHVYSPFSLFCLSPQIESVPCCLAFFLSDTYSQIKTVVFLLLLLVAAYWDHTPCLLPFFSSLRRSNHFLVVLLSSSLPLFLSSSLLKSKRLSFFSCCWLLCAGTIFFAYSPFSFFSLDRLNHTPFLCRHRTHFVFSNTRAQLV